MCFTVAKGRGLARRRGSAHDKSIRHFAGVPSPRSLSPKSLPPSPPARKHGGGVSVPEAGTFGVG